MSEPGAPVSGRVRRQRSARESLLAIALGLEAVLVFFVVMAVLGLHLLPLMLTLGGGVALFVVLVAVAALVRYRWGVWLGWVLQGVLVATGAVIALMYAIGAGFAALWIYCFITGTRLDRRRAITQSPKE